MALPHAKASILERLGSTIKCLVCKQVFTDPRMLPCCHTFCFKCLEPSLETSPTSTETEERTYHCPACFEDFTLPVSAEVPKNVLINHLLDLVTSERRIVNKESYCDPCLLGGKEHVPLALLYCVDCKQRQHKCEECVERHKSMKIFRYHTFVDFKDMEKLNKFYNKHVAYLCAIHKGEEIGFYCHDCTLALCWECEIEEHAYHFCYGVQREVDACRNFLTHKDFELGRLFAEPVDEVQETQDMRVSRDYKVAILIHEILDVVEYFKYVVVKHYQKQLRDPRNYNIGDEEKQEKAKKKFEEHTNAIQRLAKHMRHQGRYDSIDSPKYQHMKPDRDNMNRHIIDVWNLDYRMFNTEIFHLLCVGGNIISRMYHDVPTEYVLQTDDGQDRAKATERTELPDGVTKHMTLLCCSHNVSTEFVLHTGDGQDRAKATERTELPDGITKHINLLSCSHNADIIQVANLPPGKEVTGMISAGRNDCRDKKGVQRTIWMIPRKKLE